MIQSTHNVLQFYVVDGDVTVIPIGPVDDKGEWSNGVRGVQLSIAHADSTTECTDVIGKILAATYKAAAADVRYTKVARITLAEDPVAGQEYILSLTISDEADQENTIIRTAGVIATSSDTKQTLLEKLATELNGVSGIGDGDKMFTAAANTSGGTTTLVITEAKPYWALGKWPETFAKIVLSAPEIWRNGIQEDPFTAGCLKFIEDTSISANAIANTHRIADLEYFCKGERGNVNPLAGFPYNIPADFKVDINDTTGYDSLILHYAYIGPDAANQKSERDMVLVAKSADAAKLKALAEALNVGIDFE